VKGNDAISRSELADELASGRASNCQSLLDFVISDFMLMRFYVAVIVWFRAS